MIEGRHSNRKKTIRRKFGTKRYPIPSNAIILNDVPAGTNPIGGHHKENAGDFK